MESTHTTQRKAAANYKVRIDPSNRTLDSMMVVDDPSQLRGFAETQDVRIGKRRGVEDGTEEGVVLVDDDDDDEREEVERREGGRVEVRESDCEFTSILELRKAASKRGNAGMSLTNEGMLGKLMGCRCHGDYDQICFCWDCGSGFVFVSDTA
jgi:DNA mismatch repair protein MLH1